MTEQEYTKILSALIDIIKKIKSDIQKIKSELNDQIENRAFGSSPKVSGLLEQFSSFATDLENIKKTIQEIDLRAKLEEIKIALENNYQEFNNFLVENKAQNLKNLENIRKDIVSIYEKIENIINDLRTKEQILSELSENKEKISEILEKFEEDIKKIHQDLEYVKRVSRKGLVAAGGFTLLLNNVEKGMYSKLNLIEGSNITFNFSENKQEGRVNITINSTGGGGGGGGSGSTTFLQLTDTPNSYNTNGLKLVQVNSSENALEFTPIVSLLTAGNGISLSGTTNVTITNTGILSLNAGTGISITEGQNPTITNTGVLSLNSATGILTLQGTTNQINVTTSGNTITLSLPQNIHTEATPTFFGLTLTTPLSITSGGTGATTASQARTNLGAAASGINTDITALQGLNQQNAIQINPYGTDDGNTGEIRFLELAANGTNYVGFKAPDNIENNVIWTLPNSDGTAGQVLTTNGNGVLSWETISGEGYTTIQKEETSLPQRTTMNFIGSGFDIQDDSLNSRTNIIWDRFLAERKAPFYYTDFLGPAGAATIEATYPFDFAAINSGAITKISGEPNHPGILRISSSSTANSGGYVLTDTLAFRISGGEVFEIIFQPRVPYNENTVIRMGFLDSTSIADAIDGVYFELPANTLDIVGKTANNSTRTTSLPIATLTVNTWYRCRIEINSDATRADFYVYDDSETLLGSTSITTNIPTAAGRETGAGFVVANSGTTATQLAYFDFMAVGYNKRKLAR